VSEKYLEGSFRETKAPVEAWFYLGTAYRVNNELDKALEAYLTFKQLLKSKDVEGHKLVDQEIFATRNAKTMMDNPILTVKTNLGETINSGEFQFSPVVSTDGNHMAYMSKLRFYDAVYFTRKVDGNWSNPVNITPDIESDGDLYVTSLSADGTEMFLYKEDNFGSNIYHSKYEDGRWSKAVPLGKNINTKFWESDAFLTADGKFLYFVSNRRGGQGNLDIYRSEKQPNGDWGAARNLGDQVNTLLNERSPVITPDGKRMYFSSMGHNTMGGYDLFYADLGADDQWLKPVNPGYPVNTTDDDLFVFPVSSEKVYLSMITPDNLTISDLYTVQIHEGPGTPESLALYFGLLAEDSELVADHTADDVSKEQEMASVIIEETLGAEDKIPQEYTITRAIFFGFDDYQLTQEAQRELSHLILILNAYPDLKVEFTGFTDAIGSADYNRRLSVRRARSVNQYITGKGISTNRITIKGAGASGFIAKNRNSDGSDNPEGRKFNRRVEVTLIESGKENVKVEPVKVPDDLKIN
jgi:outer membrane protein OmpA-like peptidoglycan-associated protein